MRILGGIARARARQCAFAAGLTACLAGGAHAQEWQRLFDGATLKGWHATGKGGWAVSDSALIGTIAAGGPESYLISDRTAKDFDLRLKVWWVKGNSGINFRNEQKGDLANGIQVDVEGNHSTGWLYDNVKAAYVAQTDSVTKWFKPDAWNDIAVEAIGENITVSLNGKRTAAYKDAGGRKDGVFAFQLHVGMAMDVRFKDIELRDLSATALRAARKAPTAGEGDRPVAYDRGGMRLPGAHRADGKRFPSPQP